MPFRNAGLKLLEDMWMCVKNAVIPYYTTIPAETGIVPNVRNPAHPFKGPAREIRINLFVLFDIEPLISKQWDYCVLLV